MPSVIYGFSVPSRSEIDDYLHDIKVQCKENRTSFSAWVCSAIDPNLIQKAEVAEARFRMIAAMWINSNSGRMHPFLKLILDDVKHQDSHLHRRDLKEEMDAARKWWADFQLDEQIRLDEAALQPPEVVIADGPVGAARLQSTEQVC